MPKHYDKNKGSYGPPSMPPPKSAGTENQSPGYTNHQKGTYKPVDQNPILDVPIDDSPISMNPVVKRPL